MSVRRQQSELFFPNEEENLSTSASESESLSHTGEKEKRKLRLSVAVDSVSALKVALSPKAEKFASDRSSLPVVKAQELQGFCELAMAEIEIKDRRWLMKKYENAFLGSALCDWVVENVEEVEGKRDKAVQWGQELLHYGYIKHVVAEHDLKGKGSKVSKY